VSAIRAESMEESLLSNLVNRLSSSEGGLLEETERTVEREGGPRMMTGGRLVGGGALVPLVVPDRVKGGARGLVRGFGRIGPGLVGFDAVLSRFVAVRDGWRGRLGRMAPIAGSFRGWSSASSSSSAFLFNVASGGGEECRRGSREAIPARNGR